MSPENVKTELCNLTTVFPYGGLQEKLCII